MTYTFYKVIILRILELYFIVMTYTNSQISLRTESKTTDLQSLEKPKENKSTSKIKEELEKSVNKLLEQCDDITDLEVNKKNLSFQMQKEG